MTLFKSCLLTVLSVLALHASAADVAVVNQQLIFEKSKAALLISKKMQSEIQKVDSQRQQTIKELETLQKQFQTDQDLWDEAEKTAFIQKAQQKELSLQAMNQQIQQYQVQVQQQFVADYGVAFAKAVETVAKSKKIEVVLDASAVLYAASALDISQEVLKRFDSVTAEQVKATEKNLINKYTDSLCLFDWCC